MRPSLCREETATCSVTGAIWDVTRRHGRAQRCQLARRGEPADVTDLGHDDQRSERADAGQLGEHLDPRVGPGALADLPVQPVDPVLQGVDQAQVIPGQLAGHRRQLPGRRARRGRGRSSTRRPAGHDPWSATMAWIRLRSRVRSRTSATRWRSSARSCRIAGGAIQASGSRSARSSCAKIAASTLSFFNRAEAIALHRDGCTRCGSNP